jgi:hypothetical protein
MEYPPTKRRSIGTIIFAILGIILSFIPGNLESSFMLLVFGGGLLIAFWLLASVRNWPEERIAKGAKLICKGFVPCWAILILLNTAPNKKRRTNETDNLGTAQRQIKVDLNKFDGWTSSSDGFTWKAAPESEKRDACRRLALRSRIGNGAGYFYDALNAFYSDTATLNTRIEDAAQLLDAGGKVLPQRQRS